MKHPPVNMKEPLDDYDADKAEQNQSRRQQRLERPTCHCGKPKEVGTWQCPECEEWEYKEMARLNPPRNEDTEQYNPE